jgi:hypothetical protein
VSEQVIALQRDIPSFIKCFFSLPRSLKSIVVVFETDMSYRAATSAIGSIIQYRRMKTPRSVALSV